MTNSFDAIVVGGGHNGLVAGAYLARAGMRALVLEGRHKAGGAVDTSTPWPDHSDIRVSTFSYVVSLIPPTIIRDLRLRSHGFRVHPMGPYYQAFPDGTSLKIYPDDARKNYEGVAKFSKRDAETLANWDAWLSGLASVLGPLLMSTPPRLGSRTPVDLLDQLKLAWRLRGLNVRGVADVTRLFTMSIADLLDDWFESEQVKACLTVNGISGVWAGPDTPGTAYVMLHLSIGNVGDGRLGSWGFPEGGMGAVATSIKTAAQQFGAEVRTNARVSKILVSNGRAAGVVLDGGEEIRARIIVLCIHPQIAFLQLIERTELPPEFVRDVERWKTRGGVVKINLAISELPDFTADPGTHLQDHHTGTIALCLSPAYAERAFQEAKNGQAATNPFCDSVIPSTLDRTLAPKGTHVVSMGAQWVPHEWSKEPHRAEIEAFADRVIRGFCDLAPNFEESIIARQVIGPYDLEQQLGLIGGNVFHGELSPHQIFHMRPTPGFSNYRTPIYGLYQASSATHGGGGVCGIAAYNCIKEVFRDRRRHRIRKQG